MKIEVLSGPYAGQVREVYSSQANPMDLLGEMAHSNWDWQLDFKSCQDPMEQFLWARADMVCRVLKALLRGRSVWFLDEEYHVEDLGDQGEIARVAGVVEDAISNSGFNVFVESDDETGVTIGIHSPERPKH